MTPFVVFFMLFVQGTSAVCLGKSVCQDMWKKAVNNLVVGKELTVDILNSHVRLFKTGLASGPKLNQDEFKRFKALLQQYVWEDNPDNPNQRGILPDINLNDERDNFLETIRQPGGPIEEAYNYLRRKGLLPTVANLENFQATLQNIWFGHRGFQHIFVGDKQFYWQYYSGFHNWFQFRLEQASAVGRIQNVIPDTFNAYTEPPFMSRLDFEWNGYPKNGASSMFVGTSPAFEIALYSVCFIEHPGQPCSCHIGRSTITVKTDSADHVGGTADQIYMAYPEDVVIEDRRCTFDHNYRTQCGPNGINQAQCTARGCCFDNAAAPNCFYPRDHKCQLSDPNDRRQCGPPNVERKDCENQHSCCFDDSIMAHVHCYKGNL